MTRVLLIRHGETAWNRERRWQGQADVPLTAEGREQARRLARFLRGESSVDHLYTSDLVRAAETARTLAEALGVEPSIDPAWREMDVGAWSGLTRDDIRVRFRDEWERLAAGEDLPRGGGETFGDFTARVVAAIERLRDAHPGETVAVVTHGGVIRALVLHMKELPFSRLSDVSRVENTAFTEVHCDRGAWLVIRAGEAPHLEAIVPS
jgi:broad specificity phosphatase PhoE